MADTVVLDFDALTLGDIEDMEEYVGEPLGRIAATFEQAGDNVGALAIGKLMTVAVWLIKRNDLPHFTLAEARRVSYSEASELMKRIAPNAPAPAGGVAAT